MVWWKRIKKTLNKLTGPALPIAMLALLGTGHGDIATGLMLVCLGLSSHRKQSFSTGHLLIIAGVAGVTWFYYPQYLAEMFPLIMSLSFLYFFWSSLRQPETLLETYVQKVKTIDQEERVFLRQMTKVWVGICLTNSLLVLFFIVFQPFPNSAFYAASISYTLIISMIALTIAWGIIRRVLKHEGETGAKFLFLVKFCFGFGVFGVMCLLFIGLLPVLRLVYLGRPDAYQQRCQIIVSRSFRFVLNYLRAIQFIDVQVIDHSKANKKPTLIVCNHISMFDVVVVLAAFPGCYTFVHQKFLKIWFIAPMIKACGFIPFDPSSPEDRSNALQIVRNLIQQGKTFVIWPEGTRSQSGQLGPFQSGIFKIALDLGKDLTPVVLHANEPVFNKIDAWKPILKCVTFRMFIKPVLATPHFPTPTRSDVNAWRDQVHNCFANWLEQLNQKIPEHQVEWSSDDLPETWIDQTSIWRWRDVSGLTKKLFQGPFNTVEIPSSLPGADQLPDYLKQEFHRMPNGYYSKSLSQAYCQGFEWSMLNMMRSQRRVMAQKMGNSTKSLDVGCGSGNLAGELKRQGTPEVWAIDPCPYLLQHAKTSYPEICFEQALAEKTGFTENYFDSIGVCFVFHELPVFAFKSALQELHRILRPGGTLVVCEPSAEQLQIKNPFALLRVGGVLSLYFSALAKFVYEPYVAGWHQHADRQLFEEFGFRVTEDQTKIPFRTFTLVKL